LETRGAAGVDEGNGEAVEDDVLFFGLFFFPSPLAIMVINEFDLKQDIFGPFKNAFVVVNDDDESREENQLLEPVETYEEADPCI
jgi:hypothetical protein